MTENRARHPELAMKAHPAEGYDWTGPYMGVPAGSTWGGMHWRSQGGTVDPDYAGFLSIFPAAFGVEQRPAACVSGPAGQIAQCADIVFAAK